MSEVKTTKTKTKVELDAKTNLVQLEVIVEYWDLKLDKEMYVGDTLEVDTERANVLLDRKFVKVIDKK